MTSQASSGWRRGLIGGAAALGLLLGLSAPLAQADPVEPTTGADAAPAPQMTADEALAIVQSDYDLGAGGGQLSKLIHEVLTLRNLGFRPSNANRAAITAALDKRPNQTPLVDALKQTVSYQRKLQAQSENAVSRGPGGMTAGINQMPNGGGYTPGIAIGPGGGGGIAMPVG